MNETIFVLIVGGCLAAYIIYNNHKKSKQREQFETEYKELLKINPKYAFGFYFNDAFAMKDYLISQMVYKDALKSAHKEDALKVGRIYYRLVRGTKVSQSEIELTIANDIANNMKV